MGYVTSGIIIKCANPLSDKTILNLLDKNDLRKIDVVSLEEATSSSFEGMAIARTKRLTFIIGRDVAYSLALEDPELSVVDKNLENKSRESEILGFLINSVAATYAWAIFQNGQRTRLKCIADTKVMVDLGVETEYDSGLEINDDGIITLIENFTQLLFSEIFFDKRIEGTVYNK
jgi:hypothetical protein